MKVRFFSLVEGFDRRDDTALQIWEDAPAVPRKDDYVLMGGADWRVAYVIWRLHGQAADVVCGRLEHRV